MVILQTVHAQDPIYKMISASTTKIMRQQQEQTNNHHVSHPWRSYYIQESQRHRYHHRPHQPSFGSTDYSDKFLELEQARSDRRARIYAVDLKRRRPNQESFTSRIVGFTVLMFGLQLFRPAITDIGMKISDRILRGEQLYRVFTPIFLHGGILHLCSNMISLQRMGHDVERLFGSGRYLATYVAAGICGNLVSAWRSPNPSLGASGAIFGVAGAYFVFLNRNEWLLGEAGEAMTNSIGQMMISNILLGMVLPQIDQWGHLGGLVGGGLMGYLYGPRLYMSEIPVVGDNEEMKSPQRIVIDRPILRTPEYLETIPKSIDRLFHRVEGCIDTHVLNRLLPSEGRPWQLNPHVRSNFYLRQRAPNRSIKPGVVD
jgi:membrane associated rhomboid family serine protease